VSEYKILLKGHHSETKKIQTSHTDKFMSDRPKRGHHENIHIGVTCYCCEFSVILSATKAKDKVVLVSLFHKCCGFKLMYSWEWQRQTSFPASITALVKSYAVDIILLVIIDRSCSFQTFLWP